MENQTPQTTEHAPQTEVHHENTSKSWKSKWPFLVIAVLLILLAIFAGLYFLGANKMAKNSPAPTPEAVACTMEAKLCPDGVTYVGRSGPKCEFETCPTSSASSSADMSNWKTYTSSKYGITFKYPPSVKISEESDHLVIGNNIIVTLTVGKDKYFGCAASPDSCPKTKSVIINNTTATKITGTENSIGGKDIIEYEFPGINPNTSEVSTDNEYHLFFSYVGDPNSPKSKVEFDNIINTVIYKFGRTNEASGR